MSVTTPNHLDCSYDIVCGLIDILSAALNYGDTVPRVNPEDVEAVLDATRVLRPKLAELGAFEAMLHIQRGHWDDAIHVLTQVSAAAPGFWYAKALMALCLSSRGDDDWRQWAAQVLEETTDRNARKLVRALKAKDDLREATLALETTGKFEVPLSIALLSDEDDQSEPLLEAPKVAPLQDEAIAKQGYLRI
ncbi:HrpB1 family type III secretion system apparatus protein [Paraburkholderia sediminicola]|uniref:HrpB1 family type III secretion system apparatus protein n=1 Tax=Paraburkholderia sediminicola TaxID=458836 RepID=UPI0038BD0182